jgi:hypothetical protein
MEKRGTTTEHDVRELLKKANAQQETLIINLDGVIKTAAGKPKAGVAVITTGPRAVKLRQILEAEAQS